MNTEMAGEAEGRQDRGTTYVYAYTVLSCLFLWIGATSPAMAWGPVAHAVIGQLVEDDLLKDHEGLRRLLTSFQQPAQRQPLKQALLGTDPPALGQVLRVLANWPDVQRGQPGMLPADPQRHYVNLPHRARYTRAQHCPDGVCSIETLLQQRAILADRQAPLPKRAVALAWVAHLVGDMHQPLHAGKEKDRGGNLTCVAWMGQPSESVIVDGKKGCSGANLHAVWDSKILDAATGFLHPDEAPAFAQQLRPFLLLVRTSESPLTARTEAEWRAVVERWHSETQALILQDDVYPRGNHVEDCYVQSHYRTVRLQVLRAAVRLAAMLRQALQP